MSSTITLEQVKQLAVQLPPPEQLKLVARICEQLSRALWKVTTSGQGKSGWHRLRLG
jgi:hypothetical protein